MEKPGTSLPRGIMGDLQILKVWYSELSNDVQHMQIPKIFE